MTPQSFSPTGMAALQAELNNLSDEDLQTQVGLIQSDLASWVGDNFNLTEDQATFLSNMDSQFLSYAANLTAFAVGNKLTVSLTATGDPNGFKLIHISDDIVCTDSADGFSVTGSVTYSVEYQ